MTQAGADSGGTTTQIASGQYQYVFKTKAPAGNDATATHTIGVYGSRNLTAFNTTNNYATATYNYVPNGAVVTKTRDVVTTATCDKCHDQLSAHGGSRRAVQLCVMCHTPQTTSPGTGVTVDFKVFIHKLHMGSQLPSVVAGGSYQIVNSFGTTDFSTVVFPADVRRCTSCHDPNSGAKQATAWMTTPTRAACGSCHDDVNFATGANHPAGAFTDDTQCATCHQAVGTIDFDASVVGAHVIPTDSSLLSGLNVAIAGVTNTFAGQKPVVTFTVTDNNKNPVALSALGSISFTMAGPDDRLRVHEFWIRRDDAGICHRKRLGGYLRGRHVHLQLHPPGAGGCDRNLRDWRGGEAHGEYSGRNTYRSVGPVRGEESGGLLLRGWIGGRRAPHRSSDNQLQPVPRGAFAARHAAQPDRILRDVSQPIEHGCAYTADRHGGGAALAAESRY